MGCATSVKFLLFFFNLMYAFWIMALQEPEESCLKRAIQFSYYFFRCVEAKILKYLGILEGDETAYGETSSKVGKAFSAGATLIPFVGKGVAFAIEEADNRIIKRLKMKKSKAFSKFAYKYRDDMEAVREIIIRAALKLFINFEAQFMDVDAEGGKTRAMHKLALDASHRLITYILDNTEDDLTSDVIIKAVLRGQSLESMLGLIKVGKTVKNDGKELKTSRIFTNVGLCLVDGATKTYYGYTSTSSSRYGHRLLFGFEDEDIIRHRCKEEDVPDGYSYVLVKTDFESLFNDCMKYVLKQYPEEKIKTAIVETHDKTKEYLDELESDARKDRSEKQEEAKQHRKKLQEETTAVIEKVCSASAEDNKVQFAEASKERTVNLEKTLKRMDNLDEATGTIKGTSDDILRAVVATDEKLEGWSTKLSNLAEYVGNVIGYGRMFYEVKKQQMQSSTSDFVDGAQKGVAIAKFKAEQKMKSSSES